MERRLTCCSWRLGKAKTSLRESESEVLGFNLLRVKCWLVCQKQNPIDFLCFYMSSDIEGGLPVSAAVYPIEIRQFNLNFFLF